MAAFTPLNYFINLSQSSNSTWRALKKKQGLGPLGYLLGILQNYPVMWGLFIIINHEHKYKIPIPISTVTIFNRLINHWKSKNPTRHYIINSNNNNPRWLSHWKNVCLEISGCQTCVGLTDSAPCLSEEIRNFTSSQHLTLPWIGLLAVLDPFYIYLAGP